MWYQNTNSLLKIKKRHFWLIAGITGVFFLVLRTILLYSVGYNNVWEILPLHLSRLLLLTSFILLIFNKLDCIKYIIYFSIASTLVALLNYKAGVKSYEIGIDWGYATYYFYDYFLTHFYLLVFPVFATVVSKSVITKKSIVLSQVAFAFTTVSITLINYLFYKYGSGSWKKSDWFYMGTEPGQLYEKITTTLGPLKILWTSLYIRPLFFFVIFSILFFIFTSCIWLLNSIQFKTEKMKIRKIYFAKSNDFISWKESKFFGFNLKNK